MPLWGRLMFHFDAFRSLSIWALYLTTPSLGTQTLPQLREKAPLASIVGPIPWGITTSGQRESLWLRCDMGNGFVCLDMGLWVVRCSYKRKDMSFNILTCFNQLTLVIMSKIGGIQGVSDEFGLPGSWRKPVHGGKPPLIWKIHWCIYSKPLCGCMSHNLAPGVRRNFSTFSAREAGWVGWWLLSWRWRRPKIGTSFLRTPMRCRQKSVSLMSFEGYNCGFVALAILASITGPPQFLNQTSRRSCPAWWHPWSLLPCCHHKLWPAVRPLHHKLQLHHPSVQPTLWLGWLPQLPWQQWGAAPHAAVALLLCNSHCAEDYEEVIGRCQGRRVCRSLLPRRSKTSRGGGGWRPCCIVLANLFGFWPASHLTLFPFQGMLLKCQQGNREMTLSLFPLWHFEKHPLKGNRESVRCKGKLFKTQKD